MSIVVLNAEDVVSKLAWRAESIDMTKASLCSVCFFGIWRVTKFGFVFDSCETLPWGKFLVKCLANRLSQRSLPPSGRFMMRLRFCVQSIENPLTTDPYPYP